MERLDAVGDPELRETLVCARGSAAPVTADDVAAALGVHRNVARSRLERLVEAGLLVSAFAPRAGGPGAGRPPKTYAVAPELRAIEFPPHRYEELVGLLVDELEPEQARAVGEAFGRRLVRGVRRSQRLESVAAALRKLGFQVTLEDGAFVTPTCPLRPLVAARPQAAEVDRGMWAGLIAAITGHEARCTTHDCLDGHASCRVVVELRRRGDRDPAA